MILSRAAIVRFPSSKPDPVGAIFNTCRQRYFPTGKHLLAVRSAARLEGHDVRGCRVEGLIDQTLKPFQRVGLFVEVEVVVSVVDPFHTRNRMTHDTPTHLIVSLGGASSRYRDQYQNDD